MKISFPIEQSRYLGSSSAGPQILGRKKPRGTEVFSESMDAGAGALAWPIMRNRYQLNFSAN